MYTYNIINNLQSNNPAKFGLEILITVGDKKKTKLLDFEEGGGGASNFFSSMCAQNLISKAIGTIFVTNFVTIGWTVLLLSQDNLKLGCNL